MLPSASFFLFVANGQYPGACLSLRSKLREWKFLIMMFDFCCLFSCNTLPMCYFCCCSYICCLKFTGYAKLPFKWFDYLRETDSIAAPVKLFNKVMKLYMFILELIFSLNLCILHGMDPFVKYNFEKLRLLEIRTT